ncbi:hypothetical protein [Haloarcula sp. JP-L23]|uniref:hypothetical protein n=1 Tax=Haloarcula sp. JP-L23 TaxID=2716717 RepID=UPI00140F4557|nr:hypothetical protein G9465_24750 [Haloarcula sp. JP-L23]
MSDTDAKEQHRLGTIGRWDAPEADWAADYDWTRYRGPDAYPVPGAWVLSNVEGDGVVWERYPDVGEGRASPNDVLDAVDGDLYDEYRSGNAVLSHEIVNEDDPMEDWEYEQQLTIGGTTVFQRVEPDRDELLGNVATALAATDDGTDPADVTVEWDSGRQRGETDDEDDANASLGAF